MEKNFLQGDQWNSLITLLSICLYSSLALWSFHQSARFRRTRDLHFIMRFWFAFDCSPGICNAKQCRSRIKREDLDLQTINMVLGLKLNAASAQKCICIFSLLYLSASQKETGGSLFFFCLCFCRGSHLYVELLLHFVCSFLATLFVPLHYPSSNRQSRQVSLCLMKLASYSLPGTEDTATFSIASFFPRPALQKAFYWLGVKGTGGRLSELRSPWGEWFITII